MIFIRTLADFFVEIDQLILKFIWNLKGPGEANIAKEERSRRTLTSWFKNLLQSNGNQEV